MGLLRPGKRSTSKGGTVFSKLFRFDQTDPLSFGPKFWSNGSRPLYRGSFSYIFGERKSFVISRTSLYRGSLYRGSTSMSMS